MAVVRRNKYWEEVSSYIQSLSHVEFYKLHKIQYTCFIASWRMLYYKKLEKQHANHKRQTVGICICIHHGVMRTKRLVGMEGGASLSKVKVFQS